MLLAVPSDPFISERGTVPVTSLPGKLFPTSKFPGKARRTKDGPPGKLVETCPLCLSHNGTFSEFSSEGLEAQEGKALL